MNKHISAVEFGERLALLCVLSPLVNVPRRPVDLHVLLKAMALEFEAGVEYAEGEVDEVLLRWLREVGRRWRSGNAGDGFMN